MRQNTFFLIVLALLLCNCASTHASSVSSQPTVLQVTPTSISSQPTVLQVTPTSISSQPTVLQVTRISSVPLTDLPSYHSTITDIQSVQSIQNAINALSQDIPLQFWACTNNPTFDYIIRFMNGSTLVQQWSLNNVGCNAILSTTNGTRRHPTPAFLTLFAQTIGVSDLTPRVTKFHP